MNVLIAALVMFMGPYRMPVKKLMNSPEVQQRLNLSDTQIDRIRSVWFETEPKLIDLRAEKAKLMLSIREELGKDVVDFDKLSRLYDQLGKIDAKIRLTRSKMMVNIRKVLTKDQLTELRKMRFRMWHVRKARMMRHHHRAPLPPVYI